MTLPFYSIERLHRPLLPQLMEATNRVVTSGQFVLGREVEKFEQEFAEYCHVPHCVGVGNGLDALYLALRALEVGEGDKVVVPANAYFAVALAVTRSGAVPLLADVDPVSRNIDPASIERVLDPAVKAVMVVHQYGEIADMQSIRSIAAKHALYIVEDASQAHGARSSGQLAGSLGDIACFSLYPSKNLGALGDGGALLTADAAVAERVSRMRNYGMERKNKPVMAGVNSRLDELQAACLRIKLRQLDCWNERRNQIARRYLEELSGLEGLQLPDSKLDGSNAWHLFVACHPQRDKLRAGLASLGIETAVHYPHAIHQTPVYAELDLPHDLGVSEALAATCFSLPMAPYFSDAEIDQVVTATRTVVADLE